MLSNEVVKLDPIARRQWYCVTAGKNEIESLNVYRNRQCFAINTIVIVNLFPAHAHLFHVFFFLLAN